MRTSELKQLGQDRARRSKALAAAFADAALEEGLLDVGYGFADSPFGALLVAVTRLGLVRLQYPGRDVDEELEDLAARLSPRVLESARATGEVRRELDEYFAGDRRTFDVPVDLSLTTGFTRAVLAATARIPFGSTSTYGAIAEAAGSPGAPRAAGTACGSNQAQCVGPGHRRA